MSNTERVKEILASVRPLAAEYYQLTGKPLGVTGEVAEYVAAECLGLTLAVARTAGYDAVRETPNGPEFIRSKVARMATMRSPANVLVELRPARNATKFSLSFWIAPRSIRAACGKPRLELWRRASRNQGRSRAMNVER